VKRARLGLGRATAALSAAIAFVVLLPVRVYRRLISPALPARCKYYPSCSSYAVEAVRELGPLRGLVLAGWRLARCNPWSHGGVDELGDRSLFRGTPLRSERDRLGDAPDHGAPA
jgi:uncharacterized protein